MEGNAHHHHDLPTSGRALDGVALSATLHCLTGCAIGEVLGKGHAVVHETGIHGGEHAALVINR